MRGLCEFECDGATRGFLLDFNAFSIMEEKVNLSIDDIINKIGSAKAPKMKLILNLFYAGALSYCEYKGVEPDFKINDISRWVTELGLEKAGMLVQEAFRTNTPKNSSPLQ